LKYVLPDFNESEIKMNKLSRSRSSSKNGNVNIILAINNRLLREGISKILNEDQRIQIIAAPSNLIDLIESCEKCIFDILLLDVDLKALNLNKILRLLKKNKSGKAILLFGDKYDEDVLINSILLGVRGYLLKDDGSDHLKKAINAVSDGQLWVGRKMMCKALDAFLHLPNGKRTIGDSSLYNLTETELKVVKMVLNGGSNKNIASDLYLSEKTVKFHLYKVFKKLSVKNRSELILYGFRKGIVSP